MQVFENEQEFIDQCLACNSEGLISLIFGERPNMSDFRHFVSLDTRSREMRNKTEKTEHLNLVVRKYFS